jgi:hypothetical protein
MELLGDVGHVESCFSPFRCKIRARFMLNVPEDQKSFWMDPILLLGDEAQVDACFGPFGESANVDAR